jgi:plastocyanin
MRFFAVVAALISAVSAETFTIAVGGSSSLTFNPTSVKAAVGDIVAFQFLSGNHSATQSTFADPCKPMTSPTAGVDSNYQFVGNSTGTTVPQWSITVQNATAPLWFYCKQQPHCSKGMVFAVNPSADKTFEAFQAKAMGVTPSGSAAAPGASGNGASAIAGTAGLLVTFLGIVAGSLL